MKKSRVSFAPSTSRNRHTATGVSYRRFFDRFESLSLDKIPAAFNSDPDKPRHLKAALADEKVVVFSTENNHVVATYYAYA